MATLPNYYSSLGPFLRTFESGNPVLTYHKLGPRPARVRLKGLYVSEKLFDRQLRELRLAGFTSGSLESCTTMPAGKRIVITFDDGYTSVARFGSALLRKHGFRAVLFVVAGCIGSENRWDTSSGEAKETLMNKDQLAEWISQGHEIGSHSLTHPFLTKLTLSEAEKEIRESKAQLESLFGVAVKHFCYPYGGYNARIAELAEAAGYETACTTVAGINRPSDSQFGIKRFTARYRSRGLKTFWAILRGKPA